MARAASGERASARAPKAGGAAPAGGGALPEGLERPLERVLGKASAASLERAFGMRTIGDLLWHLPRRYARRGELTPIASLVPGEVVTIVARVVSNSTSRRTSHRQGREVPLLLTRIVVTDDTDTLELTFFNRRGLDRQLAEGTTAMFTGTVGDFNGHLQLTHPDFEAFDGEADGDGTKAEAWAREVIPIYPATATLTSKRLRALIGGVLDQLGPIEDALPEAVRREHGIPSLLDALVLAHRPREEQDAYRARHALAWHEAFLLETYLLATRAWLQSLPSTPRHAGRLLAAFDERLPFELTEDQRAVGDAILADLGGTTSMHRLVQGEVGSGKTVVATRAMLTVAESGGQAALLAPTEVLAQQHFRSIVRSLGPDLTGELHPVLLTGQLPAAERKRALLAMAAGQARIVIGTHALLGEHVQFAELGLVVIDEQHRFGVDQREALTTKGSSPHVLVLTATPIPRTIAMTAFGDLDVSAIRTLPAGRQPIETFVVPQEEQPALFQRVWLRMGEELAAGRQAFVVCPAIERGTVEGGMPETEGAAGDIADVRSTLERLRASPALAGRTIAPLTGAMSSEEKERTMQAFRSGEVDVVVATTVIEVGVDVPNATMMVVLDADRFGVSQLHQLRGRVGRGEHAGLCMLVTRAEALTPARERLDAVAGTLDGFALAEVDLEQRGEGDVLGASQSGLRSQLRALRVTRDGRIIEAARAAAAAVLAADPRLELHPVLRRAVGAKLSPEARRALGTA